MIRLNELQPYKEMQISTGTSAGAAVQLPFTGPLNGSESVVLEARGDAITFKFGDSSVTASKTVSSNALPDGNYSLASGAMMVVDLNMASQQYVSTIGAAGGGTAVIKLCKKLV